MDLTEAEDIKKRWQEYTEELYKKKLHSGVSGQDRVGSPCVNQEILRPTCHIQFQPWLQPHDGYL